MILASVLLQLAVFEAAGEFDDFSLGSQTVQPVDTRAIDKGDATRIHALVAIAYHPRAIRAHVDHDSATADKTSEFRQDHVRVHHQACHVAFCEFADSLLHERASFLRLPALTIGSGVVGADGHDHKLLREEVERLPKLHFGD